MRNHAMCVTGRTIELEYERNEVRGRLWECVRVNKEFDFFTFTPDKSGEEWPLTVAAELFRPLGLSFELFSILALSAELFSVVDILPIEASRFDSA